MFEKIVAAIDDDPDRSAKVMETAKAQALANGSKVLVAHVRDVERPSVMVTPAAKAGAIPPSMHFESEESARQLVDAAVENLRGAGIEAQGKVGTGIGSTARELLDIAETYDADLIVVGDRGSHVTDLLLGSVAHRIVHLAKCPVLLVR
jgi:nucleotide-binding universal stress UspA family protein